MQPSLPLPTQLGHAILARLASGEATVMELAKPFAIGRSAAVG